MRCGQWSVVVVLTLLECMFGSQGDLDRESRESSAREVSRKSGLTGGVTDSTIAPPRNQRFSLTNVPWLLDTREDAMKKTSSINFLCSERNIEELFYGSPPQLFFDEIAGFKNQLPAVSPCIRCPSIPRRRRSLDLCTRESIWILVSQQYPSLCRAAMMMKRPFKKIAGFGWGYRRISPNYDVGVARGTIFQEIRPGADFKTGEFVQENLGGLP